MFAVASAAVLATCALTGFAGLWGVLIPLFFVLASLGFSQPNATAAAMSVDRERAGSTAAVLGAVFFGIGSIAGTTTSLMHDGSAKPMAIVILISMVLAVVSQKTIRQRHAAV
jgi:DHA1 family bicyclomycin/chloramphenicol resistance-like MFS transporter